MNYFSTTGLYLGKLSLKKADEFGWVGGNGGSPLAVYFHRIVPLGRFSCNVWTMCMCAFYHRKPASRWTGDFWLFWFLLFQGFFLCFKTFFQVFGLLRTSFLCTMGELAGRGLWLLVLVTSDRLHTTVTHDIWHMARGVWHMTHDMWHLTCNTWHMTIFACHS